MAPVFAVLAFAAFQAALWSHARTEARVVARDTAGWVARSAVAPGDAAGSARASLDGTNLRDLVVDVVIDPDLVVVTIDGRAPGIVRGTWTAVRVTAAVPTEAWRP